MSHVIEMGLIVTASVAFLGVLVALVLIVIDQWVERRRLRK